MGENHIKSAVSSHWYHMHFMCISDNMTAMVLADRQGKYFEDHLEENHILSLFNSGHKIEDLLPMYADCIPPLIIIHL